MSGRRNVDPRDELKSSWGALWLAGRLIPEVREAMERFQRASVAVSLYRPVRTGGGALSDKPWHGHRGNDEAVAG